MNDEYYGRATLFHVTSTKPRAPLFDLIIEMPDGTRFKAGIWPKTRREDGTPVMNNGKPVLGGSLKKMEDHGSGQPQQQHPQQQPPQQDIQGEMPW